MVESGANLTMVELGINLTMVELGINLTMVEFRKGEGNWSQTNEKWRETKWTGKERNLKTEGIELLPP
jgi:hypothetical protein